MLPLISIVILGLCQLKVNWGQELGMLSPITIGYLGNSVQFTCYSKKPPKWMKTGRFHWHYDVVEKFNGVKEIIEITNLSLKHGGRYVCKGAGKKKFTSAADLYVGEKETGHIFEAKTLKEKIIHYEIGIEVSLRCDLQGKIAWFHKPYFKMGVIHKIKKGFILSFDDVGYDEMGTYYCYGVKNGRKIIDEVDVIIYDPEILVPSYLEVKEGETAIFNCPSLSDPQWTFKHNQNCPSNVIISDNAIIIKNATKCNNGQYYCMEHSSSGTQFIGRGTLLVFFKRENIFPRYQVKQVGETAKFLCTNASEHDWKFFHFRLYPEIKVDYPEGFGVSSITIENIEKKHEGNYTCYAKDADGYYFKDQGVLVVNDMQSKGKINSMTMLHLLPLISLYFYSME